MPFFKGKKKYQTEHGQGCCFPCTHISQATGRLQYSIHVASQDLGVVNKKSCQSRSGIHGFLVLIQTRAALQQLLYHQVVDPVSVCLSENRKHKKGKKMELKCYSENILTLYTEPKPPSPILFAASKLLVAALICFRVKATVCNSRPSKPVQKRKMSYYLQIMCNFSESSCFFGGCGGVGFGKELL